MKIKDGKIKLEKNDYRVGNFVLSIEPEHVKVQDINRCFTLRFLKRMPVGIWLENLIKRGDDGKDSIKTYVAVIWSVLAVAPDNEYMEDLMKAAQDGLARHPDWYGVNENPTDEEDAEAIQEVKEMMEFEEEIKNAGDGQEVPDGGKE